MNIGQPVGRANAERLAREFLARHNGLLGLPLGQLVLRSVQERGERVFVDFGQEFRAIPVSRAEIKLVFMKSGEFRMYSARNVYGRVQLSTLAPVSSADARILAIGRSPAPADSARSEGLSILPVVEDGKSRYFLVWNVRLYSGEYPQRQVVMVDAQTADVRKSYSTVWQYTISGNVEQIVKPHAQTESSDTVICRSDSVWAYDGSARVDSTETDASGNYSLTVASDTTTYTVKARLAGSHIVAIDRCPSKDGCAQPEHIANTTAGTHNWTWGSAASDSLETVNIFYQSNAIYHWIAAAPFGYTDMFDIQVFSHYGQQYQPCAAYYIEDTHEVHLCTPDPYEEQAICYDPAFTREVIWHEYSHGITLGIDPLDSSQPMQSSLGEALADYFACSADNDSIMGDDFVRPLAEADTLVRHLHNECVYPEDYDGESNPHVRGQIFSGAVWDLRDGCGAWTADSLAFESLYLEPKSFDEYGGAMVECDPVPSGYDRSIHYDSIAVAFSDHGIYCPGAPAGLSATAGYHSATLSWTAPARQRGLAGYRIYYRTSSRGAGSYPSGTSYVDLPKDSTSYTFPCLNDGITYYFSAVAYDSADIGNDESAYSGEDTVTVLGTAGSIASNTTWSCGAYITGDVTVSSGATLTIDRGTKVWVATSDSQSGGVDASKCELIVNGTLSADGARTDTTTITFTSTAAAPDSNNWRGIRLRPGNTSHVIDNCIIKYAYTGIEAESTTVTVDSCTISNFSNDGIKAIASTVTVTRNDIGIGNTGARGIELTSSTSGTVDHNVITASSGGTRYGIEIKDDASPDIEYNRISGPAYGIKVGGTSGSAIEHNHILNTTSNGIQCVGDALPTVRYTTLDTLLGTGVTAVDYAIPDLGASPDSGSNRIVPSQGYSYYVANLTEYTLAAELNWWGTGSPKSDKFYGDVDYTPWDSADPGTSYALPMRSYVAIASSPAYVFQNFPNPFNPRTTIEYGVDVAGTRVKIAVYDLMGRVVRVLVDETRPGGRHRVTWDGRNDHGEAVASGVYFYDVEIGDFRQAKKLVVLK